MPPRKPRRKPAPPKPPPLQMAGYLATLNAPGLPAISFTPHVSYSVEHYRAFGFGDMTICDSPPEHRFEVVMLDDHFVRRHRLKGQAPPPVSLAPARAARDWQGRAEEGFVNEEST